MSLEVENPLFNRELLEANFPNSAEGIANVLALADEYTFEDCQRDPELGRTMAATLQDRIADVRDSAINDMLTFCQTSGPAGIQAAKDALYTSLNLPSVSTQSAEKRSAFEDITGMEFVTKDQLTRCLKLAFTLALLKDPQFRNVIDQRTGRYIRLAKDVQESMASKEAESQGTDDDDSQTQFSQELITLQFQLANSRILNEGYALLAEYRAFQEGASNSLHSFSLDRNSADRLSEMADRVFQQILSERAYTLETVYEPDKELGRPNSPLTVVYMDCSEDPHISPEAMAIVQLVGNQESWNGVLNNAEYSLDALLKGAKIKDLVHDTISDVSERPHVDFNLEDISPITTVIGNQTLSVRWTDGELVLPNSHVNFKELLQGRYQNWYEFLRLRILVRLRSLLVRGYETVSDVGIRNDVIIGARRRRRGRSGINLTRLSKKLFPRILREMEDTRSDIEDVLPDISDTDDIDDPKRPHTPRQVPGHIRDLPEGCFASPIAVARALKHGIYLECDENGRYTQTFVKTHVSPRGSDPQANIRAKFRDDFEDS